jgi:hypothetical protein
MANPNSSAMRPPAPHRLAIRQKSGIAAVHRTTVAHGLRPHWNPVSATRTIRLPAVVGETA